MTARYKNLDELRRKKELLKQEVNDLQNLLTFENTKESLSAMTNGFTDPFLKEKVQADGTSKVSLNTGAIVKEVSTELKDSFTQNSILNFNMGSPGAAVAENAIKMGIVAFAGKYAKKNLSSGSWKKKALGLALIYIAPFVLKFLRNKIEQYQKNKAASSMEQLI